MLFCYMEAYTKGGLVLLRSAALAFCQLSNRVQIGNVDKK